MSDCCKALTMCQNVRAWSLELCMVRAQNTTKCFNHLDLFIKHSMGLFVT